MAAAAESAMMAGEQAGSGANAMILNAILHIILVIILGIAMILTTAALTYAIVFFGPHFWTRRDRGGDPGKGLAIWVEPVRFLGWPWGMRTTPAGLRKAGYEGEFRYWKWHSTWRGCLVLPALMAPKLIEREARRLADFVAQRRQEHPESPIYLIGYSCGGFVALRAMELLPPGVHVDVAALLQAAFDPRRDLRPALEHVDCRLIVTASLMDFMISGLGCWVFGGGDGIHTPTIGLLGAMAEEGLDKFHHPRLYQIHWRPAMLFSSGLFGFHDWCLPPWFISRYLAPAMGIGGPQGASLPPPVS